MKIKQVNVVVLNSEDRHSLKQALGKLHDAMDALKDTEYNSTVKDLDDVYNNISMYIDNIDEL